MRSESGKRLSRKYPRKLCPLRPATRAGQNAIATQMMTYGGRFGYESLDRDQARPGREWETTQTSIDPRVR
jgi:hypothetical protein